MPLSFDDYDEVFTPGAPIELPAFFFGREQELNDLRRAVKRPGLHPIVMGNRGVGKTSLVHQAFAEVEESDAVFVTCNSHMTFNHLAVAVLKATGINTDELQFEEEVESQFEGKGTVFGSGVSGKRTHKTASTVSGVGSKPLDPWHVFDALKAIGRKILLIIDEYDVIPPDATDVHAGIAELMKTLADNRRDCDSRVIIVGVAQSAQDLLGRHESIERSAREIYVRPLRFEDVHDFLTEAERGLDFQFHPSVKEAIIQNSLGYPYYVHLVGLECIDAMQTRDKTARFVTEFDYGRAVKRAVSKAFRSELRKYKSAVQGLTDKEIAVIGELVAWKQHVVPRLDFQRHVVQKGILRASEFNDVMIRLQQEKRLLYVSRNRDDVRFADPLMAPFLRTAIYPGLGGPAETRDQLKLPLD